MEISKTSRWRASSRSTPFRRELLGLACTQQRWVRARDHSFATMRSSFRGGQTQNSSSHLSAQGLALANHLAAAEPMQQQVGLVSKRPAGGVSTLSLAHGDAESSTWQSTAASSYHHSKFRPVAAPVYVPASASASVGAGGWAPASADDECDQGVASRQRGRRSTQPAGGNSSIGSTLASSDASAEPIRGGKGMQNSWDSSAITRRGEICNGGGFAAFSGSNPQPPLHHPGGGGGANSGGKENRFTRDALDAFVSSSSSRPSSQHSVQPVQAYASLNAQLRYGRTPNNSVGGGNNLHGTGRSSSFVSNPPGGRSSISFG